MNRQRLLDYCQLMRIDKPIGTLLLLWPTLWALWLAADGLPPLDILAIFVAGTFLMRAAGCVINDLADRDIDMKFKVSRTTREIQGVKFEYDGFSFSGSKVGREFSYLNIDNRLEENACASLFESPKQESRHKEENVQQSVSHSDDGSSISLGLLNGNSSYDATAAEEAEFNRLMKKKKTKRKRGFHL